MYYICTSFPWLATWNLSQIFTNDFSNQWNFVGGKRFEKVCSDETLENFQ